MPATEHAFSDAPPQRLYLDTDILLNHLVETRAQHDRCRDFLVRLSQLGLTTIHVSSLTWLEFTYAVTRQDFRDQLAPEVIEHFQLDRWDEALVRQSYLQHFWNALEALLSQFDLVEIPIVPEVRQTAMQFVAQYNLKPHDATHLAAATQMHVLDLGSMDKAFRKVDGLHLWNDLVYQTEPVQA